jgi:hypothetical protein
MAQRRPDPQACVGVSHGRNQERQCDIQICDTEKNAALVFTDCRRIDSARTDAPQAKGFERGSSASYITEGYNDIIYSARNNDLPKSFLDCLDRWVV